MMGTEAPTRGQEAELEMIFIGGNQDGQEEK